jgi:hypothetical protein
MWHGEFLRFWAFVEECDLAEKVERKAILNFLIKLNGGS